LNPGLLAGTLHYQAGSSKSGQQQKRAAAKAGSKSDSKSNSSYMHILHGGSAFEL